MTTAQSGLPSIACFTRNAAIAPTAIPSTAPAKPQSRALDERLLHVLLGDVVRATGEESKAVRCARPGVQPKVSAVKPPLSAS